ncbi:MAG: alpha/beta hydrolase [Planctomycetaceae bacterium]
MRIRPRTAVCWVLWTVISCLLLSAQSVMAQSRTETVTGPDGWPIRFSYYPAPEKNGATPIDLSKAPVVILLHGEDGDRSFWDKRSAPPGAAGKPFSEVLQSQGYAVISVDLRKHGQSTQEGNSKVNSNDYELMVGDLLAVKGFILEQHQAKKLNMRKMGIIALDDSVPVAATFAERDWMMPPYDDHPIPSEKTPRGQDVRALVLLSPTLNAGRVQATNSMRYLGNPTLGVAVFIGVGKKDTAGDRNARKLYQIVTAKGEDERFKLEQFETAEKSEHLFGSARVRAEIPILTFLKKYVQDPDMAWQDRRSRTDR